MKFTILPSFPSSKRRIFLFFGIFLSSCTSSLKQDRASSSFKNTNTPWEKKLEKTPLATSSIFITPHKNLDENWLKIFQKKIEKEQYNQASYMVNLALNRNMKNSSLHALNGYVYEKMFKKTASLENKRMAIVAYRSAYNLTPNKDYAFSLGLLELDEKNYRNAQKYFTDALIFDPKDTKILYSLAYASYHMGDFLLARSTLEKALALQPNNPLFLRTLAIVCAALGQEKPAYQYHQKYTQKIGKEDPDHYLLGQRIEELQKKTKPFWQKASSEVAEGATKTDADYEEYLAKAAESKEASGDNAKNKICFIFDLVLLRIERLESLDMGQNILQNLILNLSFSQEGFKSLSDSKFLSGNNSSFSCTIDQLKYALNIVNARKRIVVVQDFPMITAVLGKSSYSAQGTQFNGAAAGAVTGGGSISSLDVGTRIEIFPQTLSKDGFLLFDILISINILNAEPNKAVGIDQQIIPSKSMAIKTSGYGRLGETIVLSAIDSVTKIVNKNGIPYLQDIPILNLFTANKFESKEQLSGIYLITPRLMDPSFSFSSQEISAALRLKQHGILDANTPNLYRASQRLMSLIRPEDMPLPENDTDVPIIRNL